MTAPVLRINKLVKRFGGILATDHVTLDIAPNTIHALIGPNGAGKTTLVHQLAGTLIADAGSIEFMGRDIARMPIHKRVAQGIARSYQLTNIFSNYTVLHNVLLAVQARSGSSFRFYGSPFNERELIAEAIEILALVGLQGSASQLAKSLSYGEQRRIEIALALATRPKLLLLDEPLAGMGTSDAEQIVHMIERLKAQTTIVLIEHDMHAVFRLADQISVLVYGKVIATDAPAAIRASPAVRKAYLGDEGNVVNKCLELVNVQSAYGDCKVLFGMSLTINAGEVVTLVGRNGMGKTTTVRSIMGLTPAQAGDITFAGQPIRGMRPEKVAAAGISLVPEGRRIFPNLSVTENLQAFARPGAWTLEKVFEQFPSLARRKANLGNQLSGGEQQMLAIGRALLRNGQLLIIDEATEGLAPLIRQEIWACLKRLKAEGMAILLIDKYLEPLLQIGDRHNVIDRGVVVWSGDSDALRKASDVWEKYVGV